MRKTLLSIFVIGAAFVLSGCGKPIAADQNTVQDKSQVQEKKSESAANSAITSIKDAMGLGIKMECDYTMKFEDSGPTKSTAFVEGKKFKSVRTFAGKVQNTIFDGETLYMWSEGQTTGLKMTMTCINDLKASSPQGAQAAPDVKSPEDQFKDATETSCSPTTESVDFSAPVAITFTDQCEVLKKTTEMMKDMKLPGGANMPDVSNMPNIPKMPNISQ